MSQADTTAVEGAVAQFHELQARGDDAAIYAAAAPEFRQNASADALARINTAGRNVKGCAAPARDPAGWNNSMNTRGHFITLTYNRQCADGPLTETFVFRVNGAHVDLFGYNAAGLALFPAAAPAQATASTTTATDAAPSGTNKP
jgi:hypothetical protein